MTLKEQLEDTNVVIRSRQSKVTIEQGETIQWLMTIEQGETIQWLMAIGQGETIQWLMAIGQKDKHSLPRLNIGQHEPH